MQAPDVRGHELMQDLAGYSRLRSDQSVSRLLSWTKRDGDVPGLGSSCGMERRQDRIDRAHLPGAFQ